jgi:hypothetical protein
MEHYVRNRCIRQNKNFIGVYTGDTGGGKSYASIAFSESVDPRFKVDGICTSAKEMLDYLTERHRPKGSAIVLDEAGVNMSSRKWMSAENKALGELFQTFRYMNLAVSLTLPNFTFLDVQQRKLVHFSFEDPQIYKQHGLCMMKPYYWRHDNFTDDFTRYSPILVQASGKICRVKRVAFNLASEKLLDDYEKKKLEWNKGMLEKTRKIMHGMDPSDKSIKKLKNEDDWIVKFEMDQKLLKVANEVKSNIDNYIDYRGKKAGWKFEGQLIKADFDVKSLDVIRIMRFLGKKDEVNQYLQSKNEISKKENEKPLRRLNYDGDKHPGKQRNLR